ncbi:MAG TPA: Crp/Fnr family transcriptional regulator [Steroidobacteraceae bacterium]|nr:Crp/Fnr family transcriptional regulator [Steroidobacteraceae bacterium]
MNDRDSTLGTWRIPSELSEKLASYSDYGQLRALPKHQTLYEQGETSTKFYFVTSGLIQVSITRVDGSEVILELMGPQTICGEGPALDGQPRFSRAVSVLPTEVVEFDANKLAPLFQRDPDFAVTLLRVASLKQRVLAVRLEHLTCREPEERIVDLLARLRQMCSKRHAGGDLLATYLTHEQIASMTGTSRVTVTRTLGRLRQYGMIDILNHRILIKSLSCVA